MNITKTQLDDLNLEITLQISNEDYAETVKKKLAERRRTAEFKGFRKGMVPASLIKKVYGGQALAESINEVVSSSLEKFISDNALNLLGEPITGKNQPEIEWKEGNDFTFVFDAGLRPEVSFEIEQSDTIYKYNVTITDEDKKPMAESLKKFYEGRNEEKSEEEIDREVSERLKFQYEQSAEGLLNRYIHLFYIQKSEVKLPEEFFKRWLYTANEGKVSKENIDMEFPGFAEDFKWQMVRSFLLKKFDIKLDQNTLMDAAREYVIYHYAAYGIKDVSEESISESAKNILQDQNQVDRLAEQYEEKSIINKIKEIVTIEEKTISSEDFNKLR